MNPPARIRPATAADAEAIRAIYNHAVAHTTASLDTEPRSADTQALWMERHAFDPYPAFVADVAGTVAGWASLSPYNPKPGYRATAENSLYVHPDWKGRGIGGALLDHLLDDAPARGVRTIVALITADNAVSLALHRRRGFDDAGLLRRVGRKFDRWVDVALLQWHAPE